MGKGSFLLFAMIIALMIMPLLSIAEDSECSTGGQAEVHFFYSETCPHCQQEKAFLENLETRCDALNIYYHQTALEKDLWQEFADRYNTTTGSVPMTFIDRKVFIGFGDYNGSLEYNPRTNSYIGYRNQLIAAMQENIDGCIIEEVLSDKEDKGSWFHPPMVFALLIVYMLSYFPFRKKIISRSEGRRYFAAGFFALLILCLFIFIALTPDAAIKELAGKMPFPLFVFIISLADGFNPCAFTVLIILLSLLTYSKSRGDMSIIGTTFILTSAVMYFIFIMTMIIIGSWAIERYGSIIMLILGIVITIAAVINLKDFFWFKKGVSLSISDKDKSKIMKKAGRIANLLKESRDNKKLLLVAIGGTVVLAVFVNLVELGCTAILPAVYMATLINSFGEKIIFAHYFWTVIYSFVYIIPLFAILSNFIYTFRSARLSESQGRVLKLVSGLFMLLFGIIMIINPGILMFG